MSCACVELKTTDSVAWWTEQIEKANEELSDIPRRIAYMEQLLAEQIAIAPVDVGNDE